MNETIHIFKLIIILILVQMLGSVIAYVLGVHEEPFFCIWIGGASGSIVGFVLFVLWAIYKRVIFNSDVIQILCFGTFVSIMVFVGIQNIPDRNLSAADASMFQNIDASLIERLVVYKGYGGDVFTVVSNPEALSSFFISCNDLGPFEKKHYEMCTSKDIYFLEFEGKLPRDLMIQCCSNGVVKGVYVSRDSNGTLSLYERFTSRNLRVWFDDYVLSKG